MWPLLREDDRLWVERCEVNACRVGDVVVRPTGPAFFAHVLTSIAPLTTCSLWGVPDASDAPVLGRVLALARGPSDEVTELTQPMVAAVLRLAPSLGPGFKRIPGVARLVRVARGGTRR